MQRYLDKHEAAEYLFKVHGFKRSASTLDKLACLGGGPVFRKLGKRRVYDEPSLDTYALENLSEPRRSTSEAV